MTILNRHLLPLFLFFCLYSPVFAFTDPVQRFFAAYQQNRTALPLKLQQVPKSVEERFRASMEIIDVVLGIQWADLPGLLQRALLWDSGYVIAEDVGPVEIYTRCGETMESIQLTVQEYGAGCQAQDNIQICGEYVHQKVCDGKDLAPVVNCAAANRTRVHKNSSMFVSDGSNDRVPNPTLLLHYDADWYMYAIHMQIDTPWGTCPNNPRDSEPVIPCRPYQKDGNWCRPEPSKLMDKWLKEWITEYASRVDAQENTGQWVVVGIVMGLLVLLVVVGSVMYRRRLSTNSAYEIKTPVDPSVNGMSTYNKMKQPAVCDIESGSSSKGQRFCKLKVATTDGTKLASKLTKLTIHQSEKSVLARTESIDASRINIVSSLGKSSPPTVLLAQFSGTMVVLKKVNPVKLKDQMKEHQHELAVLKRLRHPNVVQFIGVCNIASVGRCIITEYLDKQDLRSVLDNKSLVLSWKREKRSIAHDTIAGLAYLHGLQEALCHRNVTSFNVLINSSYEAKVSNIRLLPEQTSSSVSIVGSNLYMAPEIVKGEEYTPKSDIFSYGILLSELDTGVVPYSDLESVSDLGVAHQVSVEGLRPRLSYSCPSAIETLISRCTMEYPHARPSASEVLQLLSSSISFEEVQVDVVDL